VLVKVGVVLLHLLPK